MVKSSAAGGVRSLARKGRQRGLAESEEAPSANGSLFCRRHICWLCAAATGLTWTALLILTGQQFLLKDAPGASQDDIPSGVIRALQQRVSSLETELSGARKEMSQKDQLLVALQQQLAASRAQRSAASFEAEAGSSGISTDPPLLPAALSGQQLRGSGASLSSPAKSGDTGNCDFQQDVDYQILGGMRGKEDLVKERSSPAECCQLCQQRNRQNTGSCLVAVVSSPSDSPASACWIKGAGQLHMKLTGSVLKPFSKRGVTSCFPPGHGEIPPAPPAPPPLPAASSLEDHQTSLQALQLTGVTSQDMRVNAIREAIRHGWSCYKRLAWGLDELNPISGRGRNHNFNHAVTMVDALDTLWIAGLKDEFHEAKEWIAANLGTKLSSLGASASVFETTIRSLGGLLSAYDLSKDKVFLDLSVQLGQRILRTVSSRGVTPYTFGGGSGGMGCHSLAESGTIQLEMRYLSHITGDKTYEEKVMKFYDTVRSYRSLDGLWPNCYDRQKGKITMGADGDSFYEYLIKVLVQGGNKDEEKFLWSMYDEAVVGMEKHMVKTGSDGLTYLGTYNWDGAQGGGYAAEMEHLTCFVPGWLALGAQQAQGEATRSQRMELADSIAYTCWQMYERQPTGIAPERVKGEKMDLSATNTREYILRPEAAEGWWYMSEFTQDPKYREWGWETFLAFEKYLWVPNGYASLKDVRDTSKKYIDRMESFFLAETMKYLYLLQDTAHTMKLDRYVFNTEAHPLSILEFAPKP
eukprot:gb/GFBE01038336.1/.p1 GENE.gb/GFBE01038336.1/~~gb/GFBE01038336.1/.p1  ORF type:complete len:751 (+),score=151.33 gb/GFBE01038336.1/:1-2253(+)